MKRVAIVGGGISGLAAATAFDQAQRAGGRIEYTLFESSPRLGGVLVTEAVEDCILEAGPDSFLTEKSWGLDFCRSLGLGDELIGSNDTERKTYILVNGRLVAIPDGLMFMVPTRILPTLTTPLFSFRAKLRMAVELLHRPALSSNRRDETVAELVERHFGKEMVERLADPLLAGVYGGDAASLSAAAVLPRFVEMEKKYGSLSRGMLAAHKRMAEMAARNSSGEKPRPRPLFTSLKNGMQQLVDTVRARLSPQALRTNALVTEIRHAGGSWSAVVSGNRHEFDALLLALPANAAGKLLVSTSASLAADLSAIAYSSSVTVTLGYERAVLHRLPPGFGFLVPRSEGKRMLACTFVHNKFPHRAPPHRGIIRCFLGGLHDEEILALSDVEIDQIVLQELKQILGLAAEPRFRRVYRWEKSMAQYGPGHLDRTARIQEAVGKIPGLALAGNAYQGIGVPDCIASGLKAASSVLAQFGMSASDRAPALAPSAARG
ncbi:MAG TPA: protoporphyrinogen oxidase [Terriglobales bacterium]|nr:protoporphyrinogen oxidase [Terriglobales bacterium]